MGLHVGFFKKQNNKPTDHVFMRIGYNISLVHTRQHAQVGFGLFSSRKSEEIVLLSVPACLNTRLTVEVASSSAQQSSKQSQNMKKNQVKCKHFCQQKQDNSI